MSQLTRKGGLAENNHAKELHFDFFFITAYQKPTLFSAGEMSHAKKGHRTARNSAKFSVAAWF